MHDDQWIKNHSLMSAEKTHALGFLSLIWSACEARTHEMFVTVSGLDTHTAKIVSHDIGQVTIWTKIVQIASACHKSADIIENLEHLKNFNQRCRENRNQFVHFGLGMSSDAESKFGLVRVKGFSKEIEYLNDNLHEIRRVGEDCEAFITYFWKIHECYLCETIPQLSPVPWPNKPQLPEPVWAPSSRKAPTRR